jgi:hypothetical protein
LQLGCDTGGDTCRNPEEFSPVQHCSFILTRLVVLFGGLFGGEKGGDVDWLPTSQHSHLFDGQS